MITSKKEEFLDFMHRLQAQICTVIEALDSAEAFNRDTWTREGGGGGDTRVLTSGEVFEKAGVNTSAVFGTLPRSLQKQLNVEKGDFFACGLSLVIHPLNPYVPTVHANYRYFELYDEQGVITDQWFGGGSDMTPYYLFEEDAEHFHRAQKEVSDRYDVSLYPIFKKKCDSYFYNTHRAEARGIGGLFYDYLRPDENYTTDFWFDYVTSMGKVFLDSYIPIVTRRKDTTYADEHKYWQEIRRGRYVEFNLIHDRGTLFGLKTKGRIESIFMSLPPTVRWDYNHVPDHNSPEERLLSVLKDPVEWIK